MEKIKKAISIITVCYNCKKSLEKTIKSVTSQTYQNKEFIIIDGYSHDGTADLVNSYTSAIDVFISEPDNGIYDAMNKGIKLSSGEWLIFMNAGDTFYDENVLTHIFEENFSKDIQFIYSDYFIKLCNGEIRKRVTNRHKGIVHHQSSIYRRKLHSQYGLYIVTHPYIISDLMFFLSIPEVNFIKVDTPIALIEDGGASAGAWSREQANCIRFIYGISPFWHIISDHFRMNLGCFIKKLVHFCSFSKK